MSAEYIKDFIQTIAFLTPVLLLVWKGARLTSRLEQLETTVQEKIKKFCDDHKAMKEELEEEENSRRADTKALLAALNDIQKSIVRIETKLDIEETVKRG